uniref:Uncharacterized protein n=1 Tax=Arundo donax TaxID=35708 RepID=A0A0A8YWP8_ARUDO
MFRASNCKRNSAQVFLSVKLYCNTHQRAIPAYTQHSLSCKFDYTKLPRRWDGSIRIAHSRYYASSPELDDVLYSILELFLSLLQI